MSRSHEEYSLHQIQVRWYMLHVIKAIMGPSIKYITLFLAILDPPVTLCHTSRDPPKVRHTSRIPPIFSRPSTKIPDKVPCTNSISIVQGGFCPGGFVRLGFCPFTSVTIHLLSQYICYDKKLNITLNFMFYMNDKNLNKRDVTCS